MASKFKYLLVTLLALECTILVANAKFNCPIHLINPISLITFLADTTYNFLDFAKEAHLCPAAPAELSQWSQEGHADKLEDWPGVIFFTPDKHEDFEIYFDKNTETFLDEDINKFSELGFNPQLPTLIYLHAFTQNPRNKWLRTVREDYVQLKGTGEPKINLLFFDYRVFASSGYAGSAKWVPALGKVLASFMDKLVQLTSLDPVKLHLISFSLGNHISGMAGRQSQHTIGRITALDPAGWCFSERYHHHYTEYGLRSSDALMVDVNHFDIDFLGTRVPVGDIDIYMNGGVRQPGCASGYDAMLKSALAMLGLVKKSLGEGHSRAAIHSIYTVDEQCHQMAYECASYEAFQAGECGQCNQDNEQCFSTSIYGIQEVWSQWTAPQVFKQSFRKMFIKTAAKPPFCVQHYQIVVKMKGCNKNAEGEEADPNEAGTSVGPHLANAFKSIRPRLQLYDEETKEKWFETELGQLEHEATPKVFTSLAIDENRNTIHQTGEAQWIIGAAFPPRQVSLEHLLSEAIEVVEVNYMSNNDYETRQRFSVRLCPDKERGTMWLKRCA